MALLKHIGNAHPSCKGTVVNVEKRPETNSVLKNADTYLAETSVHHVFKGDIKESPVMVGFFRVKSNNYKAGPYNNMEVGKTYILFLRRKTFDKLRVFDLYNSVYMVENNNIYRQKPPLTDFAQSLNIHSVALMTTLFSMDWRHCFL